MDRIRVLMTSMPAMLSEIVTSLIEEQGDMEMSCIVKETDSIAEKLSTWQPDVLLLSCSADDVADTALPFLRIRPSMRVVALTNNGHDAILCELRPNETFYESISPASLIETIRNVVRH